MTVKENLIAAKALIDTPEKWIKGGWSNGAGCYCARGAVRSVSSIESPAEYALARALKRRGMPYEVANFNDHEDTTHADIMALFDRAIEACDD